MTHFQSVIAFMPYLKKFCSPTGNQTANNHDITVNRVKLLSNFFLTILYLNCKYEKDIKYYPYNNIGYFL